MFVLVIAGMPPAWAETVRIVVLGDSLVAGYGIRKEEAFPAELERQLAKHFSGIEVINLGVSGMRTAGGLRKVDEALKHRPSIVILELGINDILRGGDPREIYKNLDTIIHKFQERNVTVVLAAMRAPPRVPETRRRQFDGLYPALAQRRGVALSPFFLHGVALNPAFNLADGVHPNPQGVKIMVRNFLDTILGVLQQGVPRPRW